MKRILILLTAMLFFTSLSYANVDEPSVWADNSIESLRQYDAIREEAFQNFQGSINRERFVYLAVKLYEGIIESEVEIDPSIVFSDSDDEYVLKAATIGITSGTGDGKFAPKDILNREQMAAFLIRTLELSGMSLNCAQEEFSDNNQISQWAQDAIYKAKENGLISGVGSNCVAPKNDTTEEQALILFKRIYDKYIDQEADPFRYFSASNSEYVINQLGIREDYLEYGILKCDGIDYLPLTEDNQALLGIDVTDNDAGMQISYTPIADFPEVYYVIPDKQKTSDSAQLVKGVISINGKNYDSQIEAPLLVSGDLYFLPVTKKLFSEYLPHTLYMGLESDIIIDLAYDEAGTKINISKLESDLTKFEWDSGTEYSYKDDFQKYVWKSGTVYYGDVLDEGESGYGNYFFEEGYYAGGINCNENKFLQHGVGNYSTDEFSRVGEYVLGNEEGLFTEYINDGNEYAVTFANGEVVSSELKGGSVSYFVSPDFENTLSEEEKTAEQIGELSRSTCRIIVYDKRGDAIQLGSGVIYDDYGLILTNYHVIEDGELFFIQFDDTEVDDEGYFTKSLIATSKENDLAVLGLHIDRGSYNIGTIEELKKGAEIYTIGSPIGLINSLSQGIISFPNRVFDEIELIQLTAPVSPGSSGGALIDKYGNLIGIPTFQSIYGENLNFAIPAATILEFLDSTDVKLSSSILKSFYSITIDERTIFNDLTALNHSLNKYTFELDEFEDHDFKLSDDEKETLKNSLVKTVETYVDYFQLEQIKVVYEIPSYRIVIIYEDGKYTASDWNKVSN